MAQNWTRPSFYACPVYQQLWWWTRSKATKKRWRHHFPHYKSIGAFLCHDHQSFDPICLKTLCSLSPSPVMLYIKFDQDWPTSLRDIQVQKCKIFNIQGQVTPKWVVWPGPKSNLSKLLCIFWLPATLMMIRSKMNELAWRQHFPIISLWKLFRHSRAAISIVSGLIWPKFVLVRDFMHALVTCKYKKDRIKNNQEKVETSFSPYKSMGTFCCYGNQSFDPICPNTSCSLSPTPMMLRIKFDQDWPTGFRDIQVWKCGRRTTTDGRRTIVYYKLTFWSVG